MYRQLGLDDAVREHCTALVAAALNGGDRLTRKELAAVLQSAGIATDGFRLAYILMSAELDGVICSGPPRGRQHTHALLDERVPETAGPTGEAALAELILRYFASHGPATVKDLRWWSSLTMADIATGIEMVGSQLEREIVDGVPYWSAPHAPPPETTSPQVHLLQGYDEYLVGYSESKYVSVGRQLSLPPGTKIPNGVMIADTQLAGHWKRTMRSRSVTFEVALYEPFDDHQMTALHAAADAHAAFLDLTAVVEVSMLPTT
jgi:hypothetical protein